MRTIKRNILGQFDGSARPDMAGSNNPNWKGEAASYGSKHDWIKKWYGQDSMCEDCDTSNSKIYDWANISGEYRRDRADWKRLCRKCHHKLDNRGIKTWNTRISKYGKKCLRCESITTSKYQLCRVHLKKMFNDRRKYA